MPVNEEQIRAECKAIRDKGITDVAIVGIFSPLDTKGTQELKIKAIVEEEIPGADVVCSRDSEIPQASLWPDTNVSQLASSASWNEKMPPFSTRRS